MNGLNDDELAELKRMLNNQKKMREGFTSSLTWGKALVFGGLANVGICIALGIELNTGYAMLSMAVASLGLLVILWHYASHPRR